MKRLLYFLAFSGGAFGQSLIVTGGQVPLDLSKNPHVLPMPIVATTLSLPMLGCSPGEMQYVIATNTIYENSTTNGCTWQAIAGGGTGGGLSDPGANGVVYRTSLNVTAPATSNQIAGTFLGCTSGSPILSYNGTCVAAGGGLADPGANGIIKRTGFDVTAPAVPNVDYLGPTTGLSGAIQIANGGGGLASATYANIFALFTGPCTGSNYPGADGVCHTASGGGGGGGGSYVTSAMTAPQTILETTHTQGINPDVFCFSGPIVASATTGHVVLCDVLKNSSGDVTVNWGASTVGSIQVISAGGGGGGAGNPGGSIGQVQTNLNGTSFGGITVGGDGTLNTSTGALTVTKTNGSSFAPSATVDTTNYANITTGIAPVMHGGTGLATLTGIPKGTGTTAFTNALAADIVSLFSGCSGTEYLGADGACHAGGGSTAPYVVNSSTSPQTILASTHNQGVNPILNCYSGAVSSGHYTGYWVPCAYEQNPSGAAGDLIVYYTSGAVGSIWVGSAGGGTGGGGLGDPGSNGIVYRTALNTTAPATYANVFSLFTGCSGTQYPGFDGTCHTAGTVTSVAMTFPTWLTVSGSPITGSGTFTVAPSIQASHQVIGTCSGSTHFGPCLLQASDLSYAGTLSNNTTGTSSNVTGIVAAVNGGTGEAGTLTGVPKANGTSAFTLAAYGDIASLWSGCSGSQYLGFDGACHNPTGGGTVTNIGILLPTTVFANGPNVTTSGNLTGTFINQSANTFFAGPCTGASTVPTFRGICASDLSVLGVVTSTGTLYTNALTTWSGSALQTPNFQTTLDTFGNIVFPGFVYSGTSLRVGPGTGMSLQWTAPSLTSDVQWAVTGDATGFLFSDGAGSPSHIAPRTLVSADIPNNTANTTGTAGALTGTPSLCSTGNAPTGILSNGNATGCTPIGGTGVVSFNSRTGAVTLTATDVNGVGTISNNTGGTAMNLSGTPALPNGTTATTQTLGDSTTKLATDAFVVANSVTTGSNAGGYLGGTYPNPYIYSDIRNYGAVCNGTNQHTAVLAALTAGMTQLYIPSGCNWTLPASQWSYTTGGTTIIVPAYGIPPRLTIVGQDWYTSTIQANTGAPAWVGPSTILQNLNLQGACGFQDPSTGIYGASGLPSDYYLCPTGYLNQEMVPYNGTVNVSGTTVTWASGDTFVTNATGANWLYWGPSYNNALLMFVINGVSYTVSSVTSATSLTLTANAGTQTGVPYYAHQYMVNPALRNTAIYIQQLGPQDSNGIHIEMNGGDGFYSAVHGTYGTAFRGANFDSGGTIFLANRASSANSPGVSINDNCCGTFPTGGIDLTIYDTHKTSGNQILLAHNTSTFSGNAIEADMAQGSGSLTGNFANFTNNNVPVFTVDKNGKESCKSAVSYATCGVNVLSGGTFTVSTSALGPNDSIELTNNNPGGTIGIPYVSVLNSGSGFFTVNSTTGSLDTSTIFWRIVTRY